MALFTIVMLSRQRDAIASQYGSDGPTERVDTDGDPGLPDSVHVDDLIQVLDIGSHEILCDASSAPLIAVASDVRLISRPLPASNSLARF